MRFRSCEDRFGAQGMVLLKARVGGEPGVLARGFGLQSDRGAAGVIG